MRKQIIATMLASGFVLSSISAVAQIPQEIKGTRYEEPVSVLSALNIMNGDENGEYRLDDTIIRSELTKMAVTAMGMEEAAKTAKYSGEFDDVSNEHWACGYISVASNLGLIEGDGDGKFRPNDEITYREAVTIMVRATGYETVAQSKGGYPNGYIAVAAENKMLDNVKGSQNEPIKRGDVAILTDNALEVKKMEQTGFGQYPSYSVVDKTLLGDNLKTEKITGQVKAVGAMALQGVADVNDDSVMIGDEVYINNFNANNLLGYNVTAYVRKDSRGDKSIILLLPIEGKNVSVEITSDLFDKLTQKGANDVVSYYESESATKPKTATIAKDAQIIYNNRSVEYDRELMDISDKSAYMTLLDVDKDSAYDIVFITEYENFVVDSVASQKVTDANGNTIKFEDIDYKLYQGYNEIEIKDIRRWDILSVIESPTDDYHEIYLTRSTVSGKVSAKNKDGYTVNDTKYKTAKNFTEEITIGQNVEFCLDISGKIAANKSVSTVTDSYAYLTNIYETNGGDTVEIKVTNKDGAQKTLVLADKVKMNGSTVTDNSVSERLTTDDRVNKQLITYKTNSSDKVSEINLAADKTASGEADEDNFTMNKKFEDTVYSSDNAKLGNVRITDKTIVFDISDESDIKTGGKDMFTDKQKYTGTVYDMTESLDAGVIVLTGTVYKPDINSDIAIVMNISSGVNDDDEEIDIVTLLSGGKEITLNAKDNSVLSKNDGEELEIGDIIQYKTNSKNEITAIRLLLDIDSKGTEFTSEPETDLELVYGKITKKFTNSVNVSVNGGTVVNYKTNDNVNIYSINTKNTKNGVTKADFADLSLYDEDENNRVFIRIVDNVVKDFVIVK